MGWTHGPFSLAHLPCVPLHVCHPGFQRIPSHTRHALDSGIYINVEQQREGR